MKRQYRLRCNADFQKIRRNGRFYTSSIVVLAFMPNDLPYSRFGFVVSKRLGKAVQRNLIKRRMKDVIRLRFDLVQSGIDVIFIARKPISQADYWQIERAMMSVLRKARLFVR